MTSILKVSEIQDPTNSNTALTISSSGTVSFPNTDVYNLWYRNASKSLSSGYTNLTVASEWTEESVKIGSSMAIDNGTGKWTFPSTGIWEITWQTNFTSSAGDLSYLGGLIYTTTDDGTNFTHFASSYGNTAGSSYTNAVTTALFDVTNTTTHKVRLSVEVQGSSNILGGAHRRSYAIFKRLGDT